jgi:hypothetical protein
MHDKVQNGAHLGVIAHAFVKFILSLTKQIMLDFAFHSSITMLIYSVVCLILHKLFVAVFNPACGWSVVSSELATVLTWTSDFIHTVTRANQHFLQTTRFLECYY